MSRIISFLSFHMLSFCSKVLIKTPTENMIKPLSSNTMRFHTSTLLLPQTHTFAIFPVEKTSMLAMHTYLHNSMCENKLYCIQQKHRNYLKELFFKLQLFLPSFLRHIYFLYIFEYINFLSYYCNEIVLPISLIQMLLLLRCIYTYQYIGLKKL